MVALKINLADVGGRPVSSTRAVFLSAPAHRPSVTVDGRVVTTTPYPVNIVNGLATVTVEPGELVVEIRSGLADSTPKRVTVPSDVEEVTLDDLLESAYVYDPPVVSLVKQYLDETKVARDQALVAAEGVADIAEDVEQVAVDRAAAEAARNAAQGFAGEASESRGLAAVAAVSAGDSATLAGQRDTSAASHASNASASATAAGQSESAAAQHKEDAEAAADLAVSTAAGIQDVADDAAQVALDRVAVAEDRDVVTLDRQAVDDAKGAVEIARDETESFAAIAGAAAAVAVEQAEGGPIELAMAVSAAEFGVPGTDVWYSIPGLDVTVTTGDRPAYASVDFGIVVADGVTRPVTSLSPRIWDDTAGVSLATGYMQALNPLPNSDPQYLLTQPPSLGVRLPAGWTNHRLLVQVQIPGDQAGPSWQFNTNWIPAQSSIRVVAT